MILRAQVERCQRHIPCRVNVKIALVGRSAVYHFAKLAAPAEPDAARLFKAFPEGYREASCRSFARIGSAV